jgi:hypothetical protein
MVVEDGELGRNPEVESRRSKVEGRITDGIWRMGLEAGRSKAGFGSRMSKIEWAARPNIRCVFPLRPITISPPSSYLTSGLRPSTFDFPYPPSAIDYPPSVIRLSTFDLRPSTFDLRPSTFDIRLSLMPNRPIAPIRSPQWNIPSTLLMQCCKSSR